MEIKDCEEILYEINKSKFLGYAYSVNNVEEVEEKLAFIQKLHEKATHVCFAYVIASPHMEKCSDDGEPDGTAGRPILEILKKNELTNTLLIVVRYFGGIKLGAGGLVRAYSTSAKLTIDNAEKVEYEDYVQYNISMSLENKNVLIRLQNKLNFEIISQIYSSNYTALIQIKSDKSNIEEILKQNEIEIINKKQLKLPKH